jgi:hypothetical protein
LFDNTFSVFQFELRQNERLLWSGQPVQGFRLCAADFFLIPFSLLWGGFAIFWETSVIRVGAPFFFMLWGIPFVLVGLYLIFGRFFIDAWQRAKTFYAITDNRIIIVSGIFSRNTRSLNIRTLSDISLSEKSNGGGTISFGPINPMFGWWGSTSWPGMGRYLPPSFNLSENAAGIFEKILSLQRMDDSFHG